MSPSAVSHAVRTVEDRLAIPLFARTTRSVSLTEAGVRFLAGVEPALADIHQAIERLTAERGEVTGLLRINALRVVLDMALIPILATLARQHPRLTVEINADQTLAQSDSLGVYGYFSHTTLASITDGTSNTIAFGEVANGSKIGRSSPLDVTLYKSLGVAPQDLASAHFVLQRARAAGVGQVIDF